MNMRHSPAFLYSYHTQNGTRPKRNSVTLAGDRKGSDMEDLFTKLFVNTIGW